MWVWHGEREREREREGERVWVWVWVWVWCGCGCGMARERGSLTPRPRRALSHLGPVGLSHTTSTGWVGDPSYLGRVWL